MSLKRLVVALVGIAAGSVVMVTLIVTVAVLGPRAPSVHAVAPCRTPASGGF